MKRSHILILTEFLEGLNDATAASSQLIHHFQNPKWFFIRDALNIIRDSYANQATRSISLKGE